MISNNIDEMIKEAMKSKDEVAIQVMRLMKAAFLNAEKEVGFKGWDETSETKLLMKMAAQRKDSISQYNAAGRTELAESEQKELEYIEKFIPKQPTEEEVSEYTQSVIDEMKTQGEEISMKAMKVILTKVQEKYSMANGKIVSQIVKNNI